MAAWTRLLCKLLPALAWIGVKDDEVLFLLIPERSSLQSIFSMEMSSGNVMLSRHFDPAKFTYVGARSVVTITEYSQAAGFWS